MRVLFGFLCFASSLVMIIFIIKTIKEKDEEAKKGKRKIWINSLVAALVFLFLIGVTSGSSGSSVSKETIEGVKNYVEQVES